MSIRLLHRNKYKYMCYIFTLLQMYTLDFFIVIDTWIVSLHCYKFMDEIVSLI